MGDRPIIFSAPMVIALREDRKTMTRRVIKPQPKLSMRPDMYTPTVGDVGLWWVSELGATISIKLRYFIGDRLWVREAFSYDRRAPDKYGTLQHWYWADGNPFHGDWTKPKASIHMPRCASRLTLTVTAVKIER